MKYLEQNTIINTPVEILNNLNTNGNSIVTQSISAAYQNAIIRSAKNLPPYQPLSNCQGIIPGKKDDFDVSSGLGKIHLSSLIDQLNTFKETQLQNIITKIQSMGPDNAKDIKLAAGIIDTLNNIRSYAGCYTSTVLKINALVDSYLAGIDKLVSDFQNQYNSTLALVTSGQGNLLAYIGQYTYLQTSYFLLKYAQSPLDILAATNAVANDIVNAYNVTFYVENNITQNILLRANALVTLLQSDINNLLRITSILSSLTSSRASGANMYMVDDYLNDVLLPTEAASYNFTLTNSAALTQYSLDDPNNIVAELSNTQNSVLIDSRQQAGIIIAPGNITDSIVSCGLDIRSGFNAQLAIRLEIDDGNTVIEALSLGVQGDASDTLVNSTPGIYTTRASEKDLSYTAYTVAGSPANSYVLTLYSVVGTIFLNNQQFIDTNGNIFVVVTNTQTDSTITVQSTSTGNPAPPNPSTPLTWIDSNGNTQTSTSNVASLKNNSPSRVGTVVHAGEQIPCSNWSLYAKAFGNIQGSINNTIDSILSTQILSGYNLLNIGTNIYGVINGGQYANINKMDTSSGAVTLLKSYFYSTGLPYQDEFIDYNSLTGYLYFNYGKSTGYYVDTLDLLGNIINSINYMPLGSNRVFGFLVNGTGTAAYILYNTYAVPKIASVNLTTGAVTDLYTLPAATSYLGNMCFSQDGLNIYLISDAKIIKFNLGSSTITTPISGVLGSHVDGSGGTIGLMGPTSIIKTPNYSSEYYILDTDSIRIFNDSTNTISTYLDFSGNHYTSQNTSQFTYFGYSGICTDSVGALYIEGDHTYKFLNSSTIGAIPLTFQGSNAQLMFLKAQWGFIPNQS